MKNKKGLVVSVMMGMILLAGSGCASGQKTVQGEGAGESTGKSAASLAPHNFKLTHESSPEGPQQVYAEAFSKHLEELSGGAYTCQIFNVGQLGDAVSCVEQCQNGAIDIAFDGYGTIGSLVDASGVLGLPYMLPADDKDIPGFMRESKGVDMLEEILRSKNLEVIDWVCEGSSWWSANKEIRTPADWVGVKVRTIPTPIGIATYEAYGANATPVAYTETYSALQLKMVEGQSNPLSCIKDMKFYEVQKYLIENGNDYLIHGFAINTGIWNSLPEEGREILRQATQMASKDFYDYFYAYEEGLISFFEAEGLSVIELTAEERETFRELATPVQETFIKSCANPEQIRELVKQIVADAAEY